MFALRQYRRRLDLFFTLLRLLAEKHFCQLIDLGFEIGDLLLQLDDTLFQLCIFFTKLLIFNDEFIISRFAFGVQVAQVMK